MTIKKNIKKLMLIALVLLSCRQQIGETPFVQNQQGLFTPAPFSISDTGCSVQIPLDLFSPDSTAIVSGYINIEKNVGEFESIYIVDLQQEALTSGPYQLQLEDASGQKLAAFCFDILIPQEEAPFIAEIPWSRNVSRIVLLKDDLKLSERSASATPPTVRVIFPNGGETITTDDTIVHWEANDLDGDNLTYVVFISSDSGENWETLGLDLSETSINLSTNFQENTQNGKVRVLASDGFFTTQDISDESFTITTLEGSSLSVDIFEEGGEFAGDQTVILGGEAYSNTGSVPEDEVKFTWSSNIDGVLGEGSSLAINARELSEGTHTIKLTGEYEGLQPGYDSIEITIYREFSSLSVDVDVVSFKAQLGAPAVIDKAVEIWHLGNHSITWSASADQDWIILRALGTETPESLLISVDLKNLPIGIHTGNVLIESNAEGQSTHTITVTLEIIK
jgi:hypothetical protein